MRSSYNKLFVHIVWSTWKRWNLIHPKIESNLQKILKSKTEEKKSQLIMFGCTENHVHLLVQIHPTICVSDLVKHLKGSSSYLISQGLSRNEFFRWQGGYAAITVSPQLISAISKYIAKQKEHHQNETLNSHWEVS